MKISIAAVTFAIAASFASGQDNGGDSTSPPTPRPSGERDGKSGKSGAGGGSGSGKSGKSGGGTKSGKSGCTDCSVDTLTRANTLTDLVISRYANEDGVLDFDSAFEFCCTQSQEEEDVFLAAVDFIAGCSIYPQCYLAGMIGTLIQNINITQGEVLTGAVNNLCEAEKTGEKQPAGGCGIGGGPPPVCPFGICGGAPPAPPTRN
jgi:hypothetical protein